MAGPVIDIVRTQLAARAERLGWTANRDVAMTAWVEAARLPVLIGGGEAVIALPDGPGALRLSPETFVPAHIGGQDPRRLGVAVYGLSVLGADGARRDLDLDDPWIAAAFHPGERAEGLGYRWLAGDLVVPADLWTGLSGPLLMRLRFEPSTVRGWRALAGAGVAAREPVASRRLTRPALTLVAQPSALTGTCRPISPASNHRAGLFIAGSRNRLPGVNISRAARPSSPCFGRPS